ncbi:MAG: hypothetical protein AB9882_05635 [Ignavibacteriaceae bacterium]
MGNSQLDSSQEVFKDDFEFLEKVKKVKAKKNIDPLILFVEYNILADKYAKLLKNTVRIAKMSDLAQKKLVKYKELMDTLRNID